MASAVPSDPRVDIVVPCFNQGRFLAEAVTSALDQTYGSIGVVVVDDGSTDETPPVAAGFGERIRYVRIDHRGPSAARNVGIRATDGEFLLFLDADDRLPPDAVERHLEVVRNHPAGSVYYGAWQNVDVSGTFLADVGPYPLQEETFHRLLEGYAPAPPSLLIRRQAVLTAGLFDESLALQEDWDLWLRIAAAGHEFVPVPGVVAVRRRHKDSLTFASDPELKLASARARARRSATYHPGCDRCRRLIADALHAWRLDHLHLMKEELLAARAARSPVGLIRALGRMLRVPSLAPLALRAGYRRVRARKLRLS